MRVVRFVIRVKVEAEGDIWEKAWEIAEDLSWVFTVTDDGPEYSAWVSDCSEEDEEATIVLEQEAGMPEELCRDIERALNARSDVKEVLSVVPVFKLKL